VLFVVFHRRVLDCSDKGSVVVTRTRSQLAEILTISHTELSSVGDAGGQVLAHLGVCSDQPRSAVEELSVELLHVRGLRHDNRT